MVNTKPVKVIAVTGGKGGVGKSNISVNMAVALAQQGYKTMMLDADLGLANIDIMLGLKVTRNLSHVLAGECDLEDIVVEGPHGLQIIPASSGMQQMSELSTVEHAGIIRAFSQIGHQLDYLIIDTSAGITDNVVSFTRASQDVLVVVCDEPTSITDAYALMKVMNQDHGMNRFNIVANMVRSPQEGRDIFAKLLKVTDRFLDVGLNYIGSVPFDENVRKAVKKQKALVELFPRSPASIAIKSVAKRVEQWPVPSTPNGNIEFFMERLVSG
ncbi:MinD/ParA family protein [Pleionea sp. CnH1-48]|uniref:MinD/ParA family ATP-binding protein n=1 Tax=Pleionea sp. CnH1-48 TaxID=2954494 RepID=UPI002097D3B2|nr:MinD/ParA family protein [Pleionea sp. CnH1-48]MCO7226099.1 MinD/ParA family protein [Pleionea sp. CnH1-48]